MLDPDAYATDDDGTVSFAGRASIPSTGTAGKSSSGPGLPGSAGTGPTKPVGGPTSGVDPSLAVTPCQQYCPGYGTQCKKRLEGQECLSTCQGEINGYGVGCQTLGINVLRCLAPFFSANGGDCNAAVNRALAQCGTLVTAFDSCKKNASGTPTPTPTPTPTKPIKSFGDCKRSGGGDSTSCKESFYCNDGNYTVVCYPPDQSMLFDCRCINPNGETAFGRLLPAADLCMNAALLCQ